MTRDGQSWSPAWHPDGRSLAVTSQLHGTFDVRRVSADALSAPESLVATDADEGDWHWAPDGASGVFKVWSPGSGTDFWRARGDGSEPVPFVASALEEDDPTFSADGRWLAYRSGGSLYVAPYPSLAPRVLIAQTAASPRWNRAARELFFVEAGRLKALPYEVREGAFRPASAAPLFEIGQLATTFDVSPDGRRFLFLARVSRRAGPRRDPRRAERLRGAARPRVGPGKDPVSESRPFTLAHYRVTAAIGAGGMGEVYRATDTTLGREVAIKVLPAEVAQDPERLARFEREAKLLASLNHPGIAHVYGFERATLPDGSAAHFLAMELVPGEDLAERLKRGPIPVDEALAFARQIAEALEEAHEKGIVHRDLKPANVKVTPEGKVKVLDFGLAKAFAGDAASGSSGDLSQSPTLAHTGTQAGVILGTAAYMSPEQARGRAVDKRADIWGFGVLLFEMLTGGGRSGARRSPRSWPR